MNIILDAEGRANPLPMWVRRLKVRREIRQLNHNREPLIPRKWHERIALSVLLTSLAGSAYSGFLMGRVDQWANRMAWVPANYVESTAPMSFGTVAQQDALDASLELGRIQAELIHLRVLYSRLADIAQLDDVEFNLDNGPLANYDGNGKPAFRLLNGELAHITAQSMQVGRVFFERSLSHKLRISGLPVEGGSVTSRFGYRFDPITGKRAHHQGIDFGGETGEPILAAAAGVVTFSGRNGSYGNLIELEHGDGYRTRYAHNEANLVERGELVEKGEPIALLGSTGRSTGPHLHLEVRQHGVALDPMLFIR